jgi:hypothetical protein
MAFWPGQHHGPPVLKTGACGPNSAQQPVNSFSNFDSFKYSQKISSNIQSLNKTIENLEKIKVNFI